MLMIQWNCHEQTNYQTRLFGSFSYPAAPILVAGNFAQRSLVSLLLICRALTVLSWSSIPEAWNYHRL